MAERDLENPQLEETIAPEAERRSSSARPQHELNAEDSSTVADDSMMEKGDRSPSFSKEQPTSRVADADEEDEKERSAALMKSITTGDPFPPIEGVPEETQLTLRALITGCFCGAIIGAADLYLGLKSGSGIGGNHFGAIAGFAIVAGLAKVLPTIRGSDPQLGEGPPTWNTKVRRFFKLGGRFGPMENTTIMCTATAAASNGVAFYGAVPALYQIGILKDPHADFGKLVCLSAVCAYWGMFFAVPFRKLYVLDLKLPFPGAAATAIVIRTLHTAKGAEANKKRIRGLIIAFVTAFCWKVVTEYAPGLLWEWHPFWALYRAGAKAAVQGDNWGWYITWSPAFIGTGMIIGTNAAASIAVGQVLAWGLIGPALVASGGAAGTVASKLLPDYIIYTGVSPPVEGLPPSPRYWLLWPGVLLILISTFMELACNGKVLVKSLHRVARKGVKAVFKQKVKGEADEEDDEAIHDPAPPSERIHWWIWLPGAVIIGIFTCAVASAQFDQPVAVSVLAIVLTLLFSFITCEGLGRLAIGISGIASSLTQLIFLGYSQANHTPILNVAYQNTIAATITSSAGQQVGDMVTDLKVAHLMGASPRRMFYAQCVGAVIATILSPSIFLLFADVYPCILSANTAIVATCPYQVPSSVGFRSIPALAKVGAGTSIPLSSGLFAIFISLFAAVLIWAKNFNYIPQRFHPYMPSWIAIGLGFMLPTGSYCIAFGIGALVLYFWKRRNPMGAILLAFPIAAGMVAGEGIGGILVALLQIGGVPGSKYGTVIGCPWGAYCG